MEGYLQLSDNWRFIYLWLVVGGLIMITLYWIRWGMKHEQFDEDIRYLVFDEGDQERMSPPGVRQESRGRCATSQKSRAHLNLHQKILGRGSRNQPKSAT
jgi:nitrogen fixation-related uncharacterized protein